MASTGLVLLQLLLLVSLVSASHFFGGSSTFAYKGRNPDGTFRVVIRNRETYDGCGYSLYWSCYSGNCGYTSYGSPRTVIDSSDNSPQYNRQWCETETVETRNLYSDRPFQMWAASCCWVYNRYLGYGMSWRLNTLVDLGIRSDTHQPNRSPKIAILPVMRVPENCPRTYRLPSFDPDGDRVRCRYGTDIYVECASCIQPSGFHLDQDTCTLHYYNTNANPAVNTFELVVEDYSQGHIDLFYADGSQSHKHPLLARRRRQFQPTSAGSFAPAATVVIATTTTTAPTTAPTTIVPTTTATTTTAPTTATYAIIVPTTTTAAPTTTTTTTTTHTTTTTPWWWMTTTTSSYQSTSPPYVNTPPLSRLPLQFSVLVDPAVPSCQEGMYLPIFVSPTPENGAHLTAVVNKELEIRITAQATHSDIQDLLISGPTNVTKHKTTSNDFLIKWTPVPDDLGEYFPICFAVESAAGSALLSYQSSHPSSSHSHSNFTPSSQSGIYQSEMRCVFVNVRKEQIQAKVTCSETTMTVEIDKSSFYGLQPDHVRLSDPTNTACSLERYSNSTHIVGVIPLNACGTQIEEDDDNLYFRNEVTTVEDVTGLITRKHLVEARFYCQYPKKGNVTLGFTAHRKNVTVWEKGFGTFTYQFEFYPDVQFRTMIDPNSYPLEYDIGSRIYMQIDASSSINNTVMFVDSCRAAPYDNPNYQPTYSIIENGCTVDPTVQIYPTYNEKQFKFSMEAFKFIGLHDQVYISCSVMMCEAGNPNTRCSQGCVNSTWSGGHMHYHRKREAVIQSGEHFVSQGPLRLKRAADSRIGGSGISLNLNLVFIAGCLLAAVGMVCGVVLYKTKTSRVKYQPLPSCES